MTGMDIRFAFRRDCLHALVNPTGGPGPMTSTGANDKDPSPTGAAREPTGERAAFPLPPSHLPSLPTVAATAPPPAHVPALRPTGARASRAQLAKVIPTDRVSFEKQASALRAYAAASGYAKKGVSNDEVAAAMGDLAASSLSLCNPFFADVGLLLQDGRKLRPADAVFDLQHQYEWSPELAGQKLAAVFADHWSYRVLSPKLAFRQLTRDEAIGFLAEESRATTAHRRSLETLLDFLNYAGLVQTDGNSVFKAQGGSPLPSPSDGRTGAVSSSAPDAEGGNPAQQRAVVETQRALNSDLDPMIQGLFLKLPPSDSEWSLGDRIKWLRTAANIFELVYSNETGGGDIAVRQLPEANKD